MTTGVGHVHGIAYAVATDAGEAYAMVRAHLDTRDIGVRSARALNTVELLAEVGDSSECGISLFINMG